MPVYEVLDALVMIWVSLFSRICRISQYCSPPLDIRKVVLGWAIHNEYIRIISFTIVGESEMIVKHIQIHNIYYPIWIVPDRIFKKIQVYYQISDSYS